MGARASAAGCGKGACGSSGNEDCEARGTGTSRNRGWSLRALGGTASSCWTCPPSSSAPARWNRGYSSAALPPKDPDCEQWPCLPGSGFSCLFGDLVSQLCAQERHKHGGGRRSLVALLSTPDLYRAPCPGFSLHRATEHHMPHQTMLLLGQNSQDKVTRNATCERRQMQSDCLDVEKITHCQQQQRTPTVRGRKNWHLQCSNI